MGITNNAKHKIPVENLFFKDERRVLSVSVSTDLPFSSSVAYDAFSDLPRSPSWMPWLRSVIYLDESISNNVTAGSNDGTSSRETKWTMQWKGFNFSWNAISTKQERPNLIEWESTSGIRNKGTVEFIDKKDETCQMALTMSLVMPRLLIKLFNKFPSLLEKFFRDKMLADTLKRFRNVVMKEDLGIAFE